MHPRPLDSSVRCSGGTDGRELRQRSAQSSPDIYGCGFTKVVPTLLGNARRRDRRGGFQAWSNVRSDIFRLLRQDKACNVTTMVDFYGLPQSGGQKWPGRAEAKAIPYPDNVRAVVAALMKDIEKVMGSGFNPNRFAPFVIMHEFEGLLFSDCHDFAHEIVRPDITDKFQEIRWQRVRLR